MSCQTVSGSGTRRISPPEIAGSEAETRLQSGARYPRVRLLPSGELIATALLFPTDYRVKVFSSTTRRLDPIGNKFSA